MSAWPETALSNVLADATPGFACGEQVDDGVFQVRMNNITIEGQLDLSKQRRVPRGYRNIDRFLVQPGDVLFNATNSPELVGKTAFFPGLEEPAVFSNHFLRLRPRDGEIDGRYLTRWLNLQFFHGRFKGMCRQWVNQATVGRDALLSLRIPLPSLPEQRRIADILDKADALRAKRRAALSQLDALTTSIFVDMFGDPATNPKRWLCRQLGECAIKFSDGPFGSNLKSRHYTEAGVRVVRLQNIGVGTFLDADAAYISEHHFAKLKKHECLPGDVLVGTLGDPNLRACIQPNGLHVALNKADCVQIRPDPRAATAEFLCALLNQPGTERMAQDRMHGQTRVRISMGRLRGLAVPVPPIELQHDFANRVASVEALKSEETTSMAKLTVLFEALQNDAFVGRLAPSRARSSVAR